MDVNVFCQGRNDSELEKKIDQILALLKNLGVDMSELSDKLNAAVDALQSRISEDVAHLLDLLSQANARAEAAAASEAATAEQNAALIAANQEAMEDANAVAARITAIDPVADFPEVVPPEEPPV